MKDKTAQDLIDALELLSALQPHVDFGEGVPSVGPTAGPLPAPAIQSITAAWPIALKEAGAAADAYVKQRSA
jgi:hypothetical protein